jgi:hypothetical protein
MSDAPYTCSDRPVDVEVTSHEVVVYGATGSVVAKIDLTGSVGLFRTVSDDGSGFLEVAGRRLDFTGPDGDDRSRELMLTIHSALSAITVAAGELPSVIVDIADFEDDIIAHLERAAAERGTSVYDVVVGAIKTHLGPV